MSPIQTTYTEQMPIGTAGLVQGSDFNSATGIVEDAAGIGFGLPVHQGANSDQGIVAAGTLTTFRGITIRDVAAGAEQDKNAQYQNAGVLTRGKIMVVASVDVVAGDPVHYDGTTGVWLKTGGQGPIVGARYATSASAGGLAVVELQAK